MLLLLLFFRHTALACCCLYCANLQISMSFCCCCTCIPIIAILIPIFQTQVLLFFQNCLSCPVSAAGERYAAIPT
jgi:hypothetical protein